MYTLFVLPGSAFALPRSLMPLAGAAPNPPAPSSHPHLLLLNKIRHFLSLLDATLLQSLASAHSKALTKSVSPLSATLTKNTGGPLRLLLTKSPNPLPLHHLPPPRPLHPLPHKLFLFIFFRTLLLFPNRYPPPFQSFPHSFAKTPRVGSLPLFAYPVFPLYFFAPCLPIIHGRCQSISSAGERMLLKGKWG